jgi:hypothetical protein
MDEYDGDFDDDPDDSPLSAAQQGQQIVQAGGSAVHLRHAYPARAFDTGCVRVRG